MKRKTLSIILIGLIVLNMSACGKDSTSNTSNNVTQIESSNEQVADTDEKESEESVEELESEVEEENITEENIFEEDTEKADEEVIEEETSEETGEEQRESGTDETRPADTDQGNGNDTDTSTSADTGNTQQDTTATDQQPAQDQQPTQTDPAINTGTSTSTPTVSGTFDIDDFVYNVSNASDYYMSDKQIMLVYGSWFIEISTSGSTYSPGNAYISIGNWDYNATYWNINTYSCVFSFGDGSKIATEFYPEYTKYSVSKTALAILPTLVDYMKASPQTDVAPNIPGYTFKPCQSDNPYVQY